MEMSRFFKHTLGVMVLFIANFFSQGLQAQQSKPSEEDYYRLVTLTASKSPSASRSKHWKPSPDGLPLEISGMEFLPDSRLAVAIRKGEIWFIDGV